MGQPVKLSDELVREARSVAAISHRSIAGQIEFWAALGKALEPSLRGDRAMALRKSGVFRPLAELIAEADSARGRERVCAYLKSIPFPHFKPVEGRPGLLCRVDEDGKETIGRFVDRVFEPVEVEV